MVECSSPFPIPLLPICPDLLLRSVECCLDGLLLNIFSRSWTSLYLVPWVEYYWVLAISQDFHPGSICESINVSILVAGMYANLGIAGTIDEAEGSRCLTAGVY